ncbi:unnamed protein product [Mucor circinelloides]
MKILTLVILTPLIATIALRSKYNFFMPLDDKRFRGNPHRASSLLRYDEEIDYTLPSYSEVPPPPTYNKVISSDGDIQINQNEHMQVPVTEVLSQSRNSATTIIQDNPNASMETVNAENTSRVNNSIAGNRGSLNELPRPVRQ